MCVCMCVCVCLGVLVRACVTRRCQSDDFLTLRVFRCDGDGAAGTPQYKEREG
jgi:hypothetical protein